MMSSWWKAAAALAGALALSAALLWLWQRSAPRDMAETPPTFVPMAYTAIAGWREDDQAAAWPAFRLSCRRIVETGRPASLLAPCREALSLGESLGGSEARGFFERRFTPHALAGAHEGGLLTGYYEPEVAGARRRDERFSVPLYGRPDDLIIRAPDTERARHNDAVTGFRRTEAGETPYWTRAEIETGALAGRGLELLYLDDPAEAFLMQVQGSGRVVLDDGSTVRLGYAAKNGHPYTSIGRLLVERGAIERQAMSLETLKAWLKEHNEQARGLMQENESYIFFRELPAAEAAAGPQGAHGVALTPGRSLAVDGAVHALGLPVWVAAPSLDVHGEQGLARLMIAQDVGSAIRGPERGDIYWGSGAAAGTIAGRTRHQGRFVVLLPNPAATP